MLHVTTDIANTTEQTNRDHYNIGMFCMVAGLGVIASDADRVTLIERLTLLDAMPSTQSRAEFAEWVLSFGTIRTNVSKQTDAQVAKRARMIAREEATRAVQRATKKRAETTEATETTATAGAR